MKFNKSLRLSLIDAFFFSLMVGAGESYLPAFGLSVGMGEALSGLFGIVPMICGALIQLITPWGIGYFKSLKKWVVAASFVQAIAFLPLIYFASYPTENYFLLFLFSAIYWGAGFAAGPTWNFWMGHLLPANQSAKYFSLRLRITQVGIFFGLVGGGVALHNNWKFGPFTSVFSLLFLLAFASRATSSLILSAKDYHPEWTPSQRMTSIKETFNNFKNQKSFREFFGFLFVFYTVIFLSSPFVTPFFLRKIEMSYQEFMMAISVLIVAKLCCLPFAQPIIERWGVKRVFFIGCLGLSPLPALWVISHDFIFTLALQFVSGFFWGLFDVALSVIFFSKIKNSDKISVLTLFNLFNAAAMVIGTLIGGKILNFLGESWMAYYVIFVSGAVLRTASVLFYWGMTTNRDLLSHDEFNSQVSSLNLLLRPFEKIFRL